MTRTVSVTEAKNRLPHLVREAEQRHSIVITRDDRPAAALVSQAAYEAMRRELAAVRLRRFRDGLAGKGLGALRVHRASRRQLEEGS